MAKSLDDYIGTSPADQIGKKLLERIKRWRDGLQSSGLYRAWVDNWTMLHNGPPSGQGGDFHNAFALEGENEDILSIRINDMRNLHTHMLNLVYSRPPGLKAIAANANIAAPINASVAANVVSIGSTAISSADQDSIIVQNLDGVANATATQDATIDQGSQ